MSLLGSPEFKVGVMVVVVSGIIGVMSFRVAEGPGIMGGRKEYSFVVDNAGGLIKGSAVKLAGIKVGVIKDIQLVERGRARVVISLESDTPLTISGRAELRADGILGDKHVELIPGDPNDPTLKSGAEILSGGGRGGLDNIMEDVGAVAKELKVLMDTLNKATKTGDSTTPLGRIVLNIEKVSEDLAQLTGENKQKVNEIVDNLRNLTKNVDTYINEESLARVSQSLKNIEDITNKLSRGEGTLGRLINDEQTVEELNSAIQSFNKFVGGAGKMETSVDFHSEYLNDIGEAKSFLGLKLQPGLDRYYEIQVIDDPKGVVRSTKSEVTSNGATTNSEEKTTYFNKIKFTALFAKNFYDFTIKGGIIENTGGIGLDYHFFDRQLRVSAEFFNFEDLYIRAFLRYTFYKGFYVVAGGDNLLSNDNSDYSSFVGGGIFITNDDLKTLASKFAF